MMLDKPLPAADRTIALRAAHLYYVQNMTMAAIGRELGTSRSTVSRLISEARRTGIVDIQVNFTTSAIEATRSALEKEFGISAHVVPVAGPNNVAERHDRVAATATKLLVDCFKSNMTLAFAHTPLTQAVAEKVPARRLQHTKVVDMTGRLVFDNPTVFRNDYLLLSLGMALNARLLSRPTPSLYDSDDTKMSMDQERSVRNHIALIESADVCLFGIDPVRSLSIPSPDTFNLVDDDDYSMLMQAGVVGEISNRYFRADGTDNDIPLNSRTCGIPLDDLFAIAKRLCVVSGRDALLAVRAALRRGIVTDLIIDEPTAGWLVDKA